MRLILAFVLVLCTASIVSPSFGAPDLITQNFSRTPSTGPAGTVVTLGGTIRNQGNNTAAASTANIRLSTSGSSHPTSSDPLLGSISVPSLAANASYTINKSVTIPAGTPASTRYIWMILDVNSSAGQGSANETNDWENVSFAVVSQPDPESNGFNYPFGPPDGMPRCPGTSQCAGGWQNVQDFGVNNHLGEDWNYGFGTDDLNKPVYAAATGRVTYAQDVGGDGSWKGVIIILHSGASFQVPGGPPVTQVTTMYAHLDPARINEWVSSGSQVMRGQQIGVIGPTPTGSTGPHLHFEIRTDTSIQVGPGYSSSATGWTDPSGFVDANRSIGDNVAPTITQFDVAPSTITQGSSLLIGFTASDTGGSMLKRAELWRASNNGTPSDSTWTQVASTNLAGNGPLTRSFSDIPPATGNFWYGLHIVDNAGNLTDERASGLGPIRVTVTVCAGDFNNSGGPPDVGDLYAFLGAWFDRLPAADFNRSGTVSPQDLFDFLGAWFAGCP